MSIEIALTNYLSTFVLVLARLAGLIVSAPVIGSSLVPMRLKAGMAVLFSLALSSTVSAVHATGIALGLAIGFQFVTGVLIGLVLAIFLAIFGMAGQLITYQLGVGLAVAANPGLLSAGSFLSEWQTLAATFIFVAGGGLELTIRALAASFVALPLTRAVIPGPAIGFVVGVFQSALATALLIAAPLFLTGLVVNMAVGVLSRAAPQINAYFLSLPVNLGISLLVLIAMIPILFGLMPHVWHRAFLDVSRLLALLEGRP